MILKNRYHIQTMDNNISPAQIAWKWSSFEDLSKSELYAILKLRQEVFVVEQKCAYLDCDDLDKNAYHLTGRSTDITNHPVANGMISQHDIVAYMRIISPGIKTEHPSFGRLLTHKNVRKKGVGRQLLREAISITNRIYPGSRIQISAQFYLESFYQKFGFVTVSDPYDEDGIPHIEMIRSDQNTVRRKQ